MLCCCRESKPDQESQGFWTDAIHAGKWIHISCRNCSTEGQAQLMFSTLAEISAFSQPERLKAWLQASRAVFQIRNVGDGPALGTHLGFAFALEEGA
jgi:hypothetical protein